MYENHKLTKNCLKEKFNFIYTEQYSKILAVNAFIHGDPQRMIL